MDLPEGLTLVPTPKGGRPPKMARDMAVWMAHFFRVQHKGDGSNSAAAWAVEYFNFSSAADVRRSIRKAKKDHKGANFLFVVVGEAVFFLPSDGALRPRPGAIGWAWSEGYQEALQTKVADGPAK
jgi:hypothetical protein